MGGMPAAELSARAASTDIVAIGNVIAEPVVDGGPHVLHDVQCRTANRVSQQDRCAPGAVDCLRGTVACRVETANTCASTGAVERDADTTVWEPDTGHFRTVGKGKSTAERHLGTDRKPARTATVE